MTNKKLWERYKTFLFSDAETGLCVDISRINFPDNYFTAKKTDIEAAFEAMQKLEAGAVANPDENRTVGHYWLRNPGLAPDPKTKTEIETNLKNMKDFAQSVHSGKIAPQAGGKFQHVLVVGIGGSALGPQFVSRAVGSPNDPMDAYYFDNTDPDGMERVLRSIPDLSRTLCIVISKSGGTKETRNGMLVARNAWETAGFEFSKNFVAVTCPGSDLDKVAEREGWLARFPMWDWVGGRTSELSAVGLLPAALQGFHIDEMLRGAREVDDITRRRDPMRNPSALLALMWYFVGDGKGTKDMVILPYNDRLELFSRYLQQLVMESLGKEKDLQGRVVHQGIAVYGNKGSTDQHAYVQQLRDGLNNFFAVFIEVLKDRCTKTQQGKSALASQFSAMNFEVEPGVVSGDYLSGFFQGTRRALFENGRQNITITIPEVNEYYVGLLIGMFERAVGYYASLTGINAYHQPGVEAGKKAASQVLALQGKIVEYLKKSGSPAGVEQIAQALGESESAEIVFMILRHLSANSRVKKISGTNQFEDRYSM